MATQALDIKKEPVQQLEDEVHIWVASQPKTFLSECIKRIMPRWTKWIKSGGTAKWYTCYISTLIITNVKPAVVVYWLFFLILQNSEKCYIFLSHSYFPQLNCPLKRRYCAKCFTYVAIRSLAGRCSVHSCAEWRQCKFKSHSLS